jgi:hypothetical protein
MEVVAQAGSFALSCRSRSGYPDFVCVPARVESVKRPFTDAL